MKGSRAISLDMKAKAAYKHLVMKMPQTVVGRLTDSCVQVVHKCPKERIHGHDREVFGDKMCSKSIASVHYGYEEQKVEPVHEVLEVTPLFDSLSYDDALKQTPSKTQIYLCTTE